MAWPLPKSRDHTRRNRLTTVDEIKGDRVMKRLMLALVWIGACSVSMAQVKVAIYKLTESEAFDYHADYGSKGAAWQDDTDKRQRGFLLVQYSYVENKSCSAGMPSLQLLRAARVFLRHSGHERYAWFWMLDSSYNVTAIQEDLAAFIHTMGDTKTDLDESESMILLGKLDDDGIIKRLSGTQLTIDEGWEIEQEDYRLRRDRKLSNDAQDAADGEWNDEDAFEAAMDVLIEYLEDKGYEVEM